MRYVSRHMARARESNLYRYETVNIRDEERCDGVVERTTAGWDCVTLYILGGGSG